MLEMDVFHSEGMHLTLKCIKQLIPVQILGIGDWRLSRQTYEMHFKMKCVIDRPLPGMVILFHFSVELTTFNIIINNIYISSRQTLNDLSTFYQLKPEKVAILSKWSFVKRQLQV